MLAKDNIDAAGERLQRALEQLQASVDSVLNKAEHELSGSAKELTALHDERERVGADLVEAQQKYADLQAVTKVVSKRLKAVSRKVQALSER